MRALNISADPKWNRSERFVNRELSWLLFNERVLAEAQNTNNPLLERLKFLAIFESNLDEFYMVRVSGLIEQAEAGLEEPAPDGLTPREQLKMVEEMVRPLRSQADKTWLERLEPELRASGIVLKRIAELDKKQSVDLEAYFRREIFPLCTPIILHPSSGTPFISNLSLNLAVELADEAGVERLGRVKIPNGVARAIRVAKRRHEYVLLEDLIESHLQLLFPGVRVLGSHRFRVVRDADIEIRELEAADLVEGVEDSLRMRRFGDPVLLEVSRTMPTSVRDRLRTLLELDESDVAESAGLMGLDVLWEIAGTDKPGLRYPVHMPYELNSLNESNSLFEAISGSDLLIHLPFDSFTAVQTFVEAAQIDPTVAGIKQTLYRVGAKSPIVESLLDAAESGKQVAVMVELKARFDESNNLIWAKALERAGCHVTFGFPELKTHCKLCLIVRREGGAVRTYAHIGTGNYNPMTARLYSDFGLFTCDPDINQDIAELFNVLTGFSKQRDYRKLLVAPTNMRKGIEDRIRREIRHRKEAEQGRLIFKCNSLTDTRMIDLLYEASQAGVEIDLIVRGICCLRPGVPKLSENIRVRSVVGRFLEHSRVFYFQNRGEPEALIGSADLMQRNLDRRIEVLVPVLSPFWIAYLRDVVLDAYLKDNVQAWQQQSDGGYERVQPKPGHAAYVSQNELMKHSALRHYQSNL